jgi:chorismate dehydratase
MSGAEVASVGVKLGVVSFLNTKPLIEGLQDQGCIRLFPAVPSRLAGMIYRREVDAGLVPVVDLARAESAWEVVSDACIASDGETLTVRVFSRIPPEDVHRIHVDGDSHTSVVLARLIWSARYNREVSLRPLDTAAGWDECDCEAILLIGDKVIARQPRGFAYDVDLGAAWKEWTGLPFVFAVWVVRAGCDWSRLGRILSEARDRGVADARRLAREHGPARGWPVEVAEAYLTRYMQYVLTPEARLGMEQFMAMSRALGLLGVPEELATT